jgi:subtilisin family serine protease
MIRFFAFCFFLSWSALALAQRKYTLHWVSFKDKAASPYSLWHPQAYLSPRALERRRRFGLEVDSTDLPVNPQYLQALREKGLVVRNVSRWLNGAAVEASTEEAAKAKDLPFVQSVEPIGFARSPQAPDTRSQRPKNNDYRARADYYGYGQNQLDMLGGQFIHRMGYRGKGLWVAIMDGGFTQVQVTPAFDSLRKNYQLLGTRDFVEGDEYVYEASDHGRDVLSTMAANIPNLLIGTAPEASYFLFKTEDEKGEFVAEEYHWVAAAEYADSLGVDVFNTSLGYYDFDDNMMDYAYDDLNGQYTPSSIAAHYAAQKGILVVTSAGNEGDGKWKHITTPGDAPSSLTVGAVDREGKPSRFSSEGFPERSYVKPNVSARGMNAIVAAPARYDISYQSGTSFSSPIMAGMATSLWQSLPKVSNLELIRALERFASKAEEPDFKMGYGIPNTFAVYQALKGDAILLKEPYFSFKQPCIEQMQFFAQGVKEPTVSLRVEAVNGAVVHEYQAELSSKQRELWYYALPNWAQQASGLYLITISFGDKVYRGTASKP